MCKVLIVFYSMYGHIYKMAEAAAQGVGEVAGCEAIIKRVPETLPGEVLEKMGAVEAQKGMANIPIATVNDLVGKVGSVFASSATQHGGQESTILSFHITLLHQGMVVVGLPYAFAGQMGVTELTGCSPYGASTITGGQGERMPSENELAGARYQAAHVARIALKLKG